MASHLYLSDICYYRLNVIITFLRLDVQPAVTYQVGPCDGALVSDTGREDPEWKQDCIVRLHARCVVGAEDKIRAGRCPDPKTA